MPTVAFSRPKGSAKPSAASSGRPPATSPASAPEALELAHGDRAVDDDAARHPGGDRHRGLGDGRAGAPAADDPGHAGVAQLAYAEIGRHEGGLVSIVREGGEAVDVIHAEARVRD